MLLYNTVRLRQKSLLKIPSFLRKISSRMRRKRIRGGEVEGGVKGRETKLVANEKGRRGKKIGGRREKKDKTR